ncbi:MAG: hypothetical protein LBD31_02760 [Treponema sp.]|jgi:hypothetical protein|nr:hypothetical protein [Treponema sp.]
MKKCLLFAGLILLAGATLEAQRRAAWNPVDSPEELAGRWEGSQIMPIPQNAEAGMPQSFLKITISMDYAEEGGVTVILTMDFGQLLSDWTAMPEAKQAGLTKDLLWDMMSAELANAFDGAALAGAYTMTLTISGSMEDLMGDESLKTELSRDRKKLKLTFPQKLSLGLGDEGFQEIILNKQ